MLVHKGCSGHVFADLSDAFKLYAEVNSTQDNAQLQTVRIHLYQLASEITSVTLVCTSCHTTVDLDNTLIQCRKCGSFYPISDSFSPRESGGIYCNKCIKLIPDEVHNRLEVIFSKTLLVR